METNQKAAAALSGTAKFSIAGILPLMIMVMLALTEWISWSENGSFFQGLIPTLSAQLYFYSGAGLIALSLVLLAWNETFTALMEYLGFFTFIHSPLVNYKPFKKTIYELILPLILTVLVIALCISAIPELKADYTQTKSRLSLIFTLILLTIILGKLRIPRVEQLNGLKGEFMTTPGEVYGVFDIKNFIVYREKGKQWENVQGDMLIINGERVTILNPDRMKNSENVDVDNPAGKFQLALVIHPLRENYPSMLSNDEMNVCRDWFSASDTHYAELLKMVSNSAGNALKAYLSHIFGISGDGSLLTNRLAEVIKRGAKKGIDLLYDIDFKSIATDLENNLTSAVIGSQRAESSSIFKLQLSLKNHSLSETYAAYDKKLGDIAEQEETLNTQSRNAMIEQLAVMYVSQDPSNLYRLQEVKEILFSNERTSSTLEKYASERQIVDENAAPKILQLDLSEQLARKVGALSELSQWIKQQPLSEREAETETIVKAAYFKLLKLDLIGAFPPGISTQEIKDSLAEKFGVPLRDILDPQNDFYQNEVSRQRMAEQISTTR